MAEPTAWPQLIADVIKALAWPGTALVIFFVLRNQILGLIPSLEQLRYKDLELRFRQRLNKVEQEAELVELPAAPPQELPAPPPPDQAASLLPDYLYPLAMTSPTATVLEAWARLEAEMRRQLARA